MYPTPVGPQFEPVGRCAARRRRLALAAWRAQRSRSTTSTSPMTASWCQAARRSPSPPAKSSGSPGPTEPTRRIPSRSPKGCAVACDARRRRRARARHRPPTQATASGTWFTAADLIASGLTARRRSAGPAGRARRRQSRLAGAGRWHLSRVVRKPYGTLSGRQRHCSSLSRWSTAHGSCSLDELTQGPRSRRTAGNVAADRASPRQGHHSRGVE